MPCEVPPMLAIPVLRVEVSPPRRSMLSWSLSAWRRVSSMCSWTLGVVLQHLHEASRRKPPSRPQRSCLAP